MLDNDKLVDLLHYNGTREYTREDGNVAYLDGTRLGRPPVMPQAQRIILGVIVIVAIIIGIFILKDTVIANIQESLTREQTVAANIVREASLETVPDMATLINMDDASIQALFAEQGYTFYDATALTESGNMMLFKIPSDMTLDEAAAFYLRGLGSLNASDASKVLCGSWLLSVDRINTTSMVVRYVDFSTGNPQAAIQNALAKEGFDAASLTDSGIDDSKNTFSTGTLDAAGTPCMWRISALPLEEMYSISGLPEDACYVGIRVTKQ